METIDYPTLEALNKEWTAFLRTIPDSGLGSSVAEGNRMFASRRNIWMRRMRTKYRVTMQQLKDNYIHD